MMGTNLRFLQPKSPIRSENGTDAWEDRRIRELIVCVQERNTESYVVIVIQTRTQFLNSALPLPTFMCLLNGDDHLTRIPSKTGIFCTTLSGAFSNIDFTLGMLLGTFLMSS